MDDCVASVVGRLVSPVSEAVRDQAQRLVQTLKSSDKPEFQENATTWAVCSIYIATVHVKYGKGIPVSSLDSVPETSSLPTVTDLLHASNVNIKDFFNQMSLVEEVIGLNDTVKNSLMTLKQKYLITYAIFRKFEMLYNKLFKSPDEMPCSSNGSCDVTCDKRRICWLLFLIAKGSMLSECSELVLPLHLMLSCMEFMLQRALPFTIREAHSAARFDTETDGEGSRQRLLDVVCQEAGVGQQVEEVAMVTKSIFQPFMSPVQQESPGSDVEGFPQLDYLEARYQQMYQAQGDIDEVCFLTYDPTLTPGQPAQPSVPPSPDSTVKSPVFLTPVRRAITTVQALKSLLAGASDTPSDVLTRYFESCSVNPERSIEQRVERLKELFVGHYVGEIGVQASELACTRFKLGLRFYYRIMESMLIKEEKRLSTSDFSTLLNNDAFHRSLLACALEVVMVTFGYTASPINPGMSALSSKLLFPWILDVFNLQSFNFIKVIESFIKNEPRLTEEALKHLQGIETQIIESLAWAVSSPLFEALNAVRGIEISNSLSQSPRPNAVSHTTAADMFLSPVRPGHYSRPRPNEATPPRHTNGSSRLLDTPSPKASRGVAGAQQEYPSPRPSHVVGVLCRDRPGSVTLNMFFNKVLQLAYHRLHTMCNLLTINKELNRVMWTSVEHCITNKPWLMKGRHLDQIIMCCIYAVCKVRDCELKFKQIVNMYRGLPHAVSQTYRNVFMGPDKDGVSIIAFYNELFIPSLREYIHKFQLPVSSANLSPVPSRCQATAAQATPVYQMPGTSLYISPMKDSPFKSPHPVPAVSSPGQMTPRTRMLYSFGETLCTERLREFNEQVATTTDQPSRPLKKRRKLELPGIEDEEEGEGSASKDESVDEADGAGFRPIQGAAEMSSMQRRISQYASDSQSNRPQPVSVQTKPGEDVQKE